MLVKLEHQNLALSMMVRVGIQHVFLTYNFIVIQGSMYEDGVDPTDPSFDPSEYDDEYVPSPLLRGAVAQSAISLSEYKRAVEPLITSYFINGDTETLMETILVIYAPEYANEFFKRAIKMSFDKGDRERELVSQLLSLGYPNIFSSSMIGKGFERLFELIDEICKDVPNAGTMLATFLTRAVVDEVLPPSFLNDAVVCNLGGDVVVQAKSMLSLHHGGAKFERSWGPGDGRSVEELKIALDLLLQEYLLSGDVNEAERCIIEMGSPQFYHEVVKRAVVNSLDKSENDQIRMSQLLAHLHARQQLSDAQAKKGFDRLHSLLPDLTLDSPCAAGALAKFVDRAKADKVLASQYTYTGSEDGNGAV
jgi:programmed cell death protein 4